MGFFSNIKAMNNLQKIRRGGTACFTISAIVNLTINLPDAQKALDNTTFNQVFKLYKKMNRCKTKIELDIDGYFSTVVDILREFDKIAPCEPYLGMESFEATMIMRRVRKMDDVKHENM